MNLKKKNTLPSNNIYNNNEYLKNNFNWHQEDSPYKASFVKKIIKPFLEYGIGFSIGIFQKQIFRKKLTVFCFHDVTNTPSDFSRENYLNIPTEVFDYQIRYIKKNFNLFTYVNNFLFSMLF